MPGWITFPSEVQPVPIISISPRTRLGLNFRSTQTQEITLCGRFALPDETVVSNNAFELASFVAAKPESPKLNDHLFALAIS